MACTLRGEVTDERESIATREERTYRRRFIVTSDNDNDGPLQARLCAGVPRIGSIYNTGTEVDIQALCTRKTAVQAARSRRIWMVDCEFSTEHEELDPDQGGDQEQIENIEVEPTEVEFGYEQFRSPVPAKCKIAETTEGLLVVNEGAVTACGEPFDPPPEYDDARPVLTITRSELVFNPQRATAYMNSINSDVFSGAPPRTCRIVNISARRVRNKGLRYWRVSYVISYNKQAWDLALLHIGSVHFDTDDNGNKILKHFVTADDPPQPRLGLLRRDGYPLDAGDVPDYRVLQVYEAKPFAVLGLERELM